MNERSPLLVIAALAASVAAVDDIELETQYGHRFPVVLANEPLIIVYADRKGSRQTRPWIDAINDGNCKLLEAAKLDGVPLFIRPFVRNAFDEGNPVAMDWHGEIAARYGFDPDRANVYLIDGTGRLFAHYSGPADNAVLEQLERRMGELCRERD